MALDANQLKKRPISYVLSADSDIRIPACEGTWMEFGVAAGATINATAKYRETVCGPLAPPVYG